MTGMANTTQVYGKSTFASVMAEQIMLRAIATSYASQIITILQECAQYMTLTPAISALTDTQKSAVGNALAGRTYTGFDAVAAAYAAAAATPITPSQPPSSGGGGFSGGGGGGATSQIKTDSDFATPEIPTPPPLFSDLNGFDWAADSIQYLVEKGVISGYGDRTFRPAQDVAREEFVKMLVTGFSLQDDTAACSFSDVAQTDWFYPYVAVAQKYGIVKGVSDTEFGVGQNISRQDLCTVVYRIAVRNGFTFPQSQTAKTFADGGAIAYYAKDSVSALQQAGIVSGKDADSFYPDDPATRAEAAKILAQTMRLIAAEQAASASPSPSPSTGGNSQ